MSNIKSRSYISIQGQCHSNNRLTQCTCNGLIVNGRYWDAIFDLQSKVCDVTFRWSLLDFTRIVCRLVRIMWKKTCFLVRGGAYAFEKLAKLHCVQPVPRLIHGTSTLTTQSTSERLPVASRRTWGPIDNISFGALSAEHDEVTTMAVAISRVFVVPVQCQARHGECLDNVYNPKEIIPPESRLCIDCLLLDAISALPRLPSPESDAHIKVR